MKKLLMLSVIVLILGCANTPRNIAPIEDAQIFKASFNKTWAALVAIVSEMGLEIATIEKDSGLISTKQHVFMGVDAPTQVEKPRTIDEWVYPPSISAQLLGGGWQAVGYRLNILATLLDENTTKIKVTAVFDGTTTSGIKHKMPSKGVIEKKVLDSIMEKL